MGEKLVISGRRFGKMTEAVKAVKESEDGYMICSSEQSARRVAKEYGIRTAFCKDRNLPERFKELVHPKKLVIIEPEDSKN